MTISSEDRTAGPYTGTGAVSTYSFEFKVFTDAELVVIRTDTDGMETTLVLDTDYDVSLNADQDANPGGSITLTSALTTDYLLTITSEVEATQNTELENQGAFFPAVIETAFDKLTVLIQQLANLVGRSLKIPVSDGTAVTTELDTKTLRASKFLGFDAEGDVALYLGVTETPATAFAATLLDDATAADARATLGAPLTSEVILKSLVSAKGDVIAGTASATVARLPVGSNGQLLTPSSSTSTGLLWTDRNDGFRNRIINGNMLIDQRNVGAAVSVATVTPLYTLDRYAAVGQAAAGVFTVQRLSASPPSGFSYYLRITTTTADASPAAGAYYYLAQAIEGFNVVDFALGSAGALTFTMSAQLRSSMTGTFSGVFNNNGSSRTYPWTCTISATNTWTPITVTVPGDQTGTWLTDQSTGLRLCFDIGCGSTYRGAAGAWVASQIYGVTGAARLISTLNATLDITGLQVEAGSVATAFEHLSASDQLFACRRYYAKTFAAGVAPAQSAGVTGALFLRNSNGGGNFGAMWSLPNSMRSIPTIVTYNTSAASANWRDLSNSADRTVSVSDTSERSVMIDHSAGAGVAGALNAIHATADAEI